MKKFIFIAFIPLILGIILLVAGAVLFIVGLNGRQYEKTELNTCDLSGKTFSNIDIALTTEDIIFEVSEDGSKKVVFREGRNFSHDAEVENGVLLIRARDDRRWYDKIFGLYYSKMTVTVFLPAGEYGSLKIDSSTGGVTIPKGLSFGSVGIKLSTGSVSGSIIARETASVESSTGSISLDEVQAEKLRSSASTGNITVKNVGVVNDIDLKTSTGNISLSGAAGGALRVSTSTGRVTLAKTVITGSMTVNTSTGSVYFDDSDAESVRIETTTGSVRGSLLTDKIFSVTTKTGKTDVPVSTSGGLCRIITNTGNVSIVIKKQGS
ncbi:MAG: DUF4097 family beta strand repeat protein [Clostridia bacterium]|nr:DUF4097 family beta strand repeat protein [Clostridia bacterium]